MFFGIAVMCLLSLGERLNSHLRVHARVLLLQLPQISPSPEPASTLFESPLRPNGENQAVTPGGFQEYRELVVQKRMIQDCAAQMELICTGNQCALLRAEAPCSH